MMIGPNLISTATAMRSGGHHHNAGNNGGFEIISHRGISGASKTKRKFNSGAATPKGGGKKSRQYLQAAFQNSGYDLDEDPTNTYAIFKSFKDDAIINAENDDLQLDISNFCKGGLEQAQLPQEGDGDNTKEVENSNLSWLLNFKVASLFDPTEDANSSRRSSSEDDSKEGREEMSSLLSSPDRPNKPPYTYTELIEQALKDKGELTVSGIYYWISEKFPFYKVHDDRWKNSVRHNLSINPHFRKGMKASQGAGHLWTLSSQGVTPSPDVWKKNRVKNLINLMDEVAVATASIEEPSDSPAPEELSPQPSLPLTESSPDPSLARSAEEILSGVKKQVEVQYLTSEFLNTMTKDEIIDEEASLVTEVISTPYLINDLGSEVILSDGLFCDDLNFQCCELTSTTNL